MAVVPEMADRLTSSSPTWSRTGLVGAAGRGMLVAVERVSDVVVAVASAPRVTGTKVMKPERSSASGLRLKAPLRLTDGAPVHNTLLRRKTAHRGMA